MVRQTPDWAVIVILLLGLMGFVVLAWWQYQMMMLFLTAGTS